MASNEKTEKRILRISLFAGIGFVVLEFLMAIISKSQSILMDTAFDASELFVIAVSLLLTPLLYKPITEKRPFGYSQCESLFLLVKGCMLVAVVLSLIGSNIQVMITGGNHIDAGLVSLFEMILSVLSLGVLLLLIHYGKRINSPMIAAEIYGWKVDTICGIGVSAAFLLPRFLENTSFLWIAPYFDQIVAIVLAVFMLPECIRMVTKAFHELLLFAPKDGTLTKIKEVVTHVCKEEGIEATFVDVVQTGRKTWVAVTLNKDTPDWNIGQMKAVYRKLHLELQKEYEEVYLELIPDLED